MRDLIRVEQVSVNSLGAMVSLNLNAQTTSGGGAVPFTALLLQALGVVGVGATPVIIVAGGDIADGVAAIGTGASSGFGGVISIARGTIFNGATWDRLREVAGDAQAKTGILASHGTLWNGATYDRTYEVAGDGVAATGLAVNHPTLWNGATYDRRYEASAANMAAQPQKGVALVTGPGNWTLTSNPGSAAQPTATRAAGAAGVRHVLTSISAQLANSAGVATVAIYTVVVRDGASGVGTILWQALLAIATTVNNSPAAIQLSGLSIVGSAATAMTVEFTAATEAGQNGCVSATGYDAT